MENTQVFIHQTKLNYRMQVGQIQFDAWIFNRVEKEVN